ncbi:MAG TPA: 2'-5' RNA ligase family protein, partial [Burkholderiaceae bacterium]|nr:2'-5' RNA ligase family protein [Burkholderiaceae bacterium]
QQAGARVQAPPFELRLDAVRRWQRAGVCVAVCSRPPAALLDAQRQLRDAVAGAGFAVDERPFRPHVTLLRTARGAAPAASDGGSAGADRRAETAAAGARNAAPLLTRPIAWQVVEFVLARSTPAAGGSRYDPLVRFALSGSIRD